MAKAIEHNTILPSTTSINGPGVAMAKTIEHDSVLGVVIGNFVATRRASRITPRPTQVKVKGQRSAARRGARQRPPSSATWCSARTPQRPTSTASVAIRLACEASAERVVLLRSCSSLQSEISSPLLPTLRPSAAGAK